MSDADTIVEYLGGELDEAAATAFEDDLFSGRLDGSELSELSGLTVALREAAFVGILSVTVTREEMERIRAAGYRIVESRPEPGVETVGDLSGDFDLLFLEYELDLRGVDRLDCEVCDHTGKVIKRNTDLPFDPEAPTLSGFCARELALVGNRNNPDGMITRFLAVGPEGDRLLAEFRTRATMPPD